MRIFSPVVDVSTLSFSVTSYIELYVTMDTENTYLQLAFNPSSPDGYLFYAGNHTHQDDFLSISLVGGRLDLRYDLGSGSVKPLRSGPLDLNVWHTVFVIRQSRTARMVVDGVQHGPVVSPGGYFQLNVQRRVNVGGLVNYDIVSPLANREILGFSGCITSLVVSNNEMGGASFFFTTAIFLQNIGHTM